MSKGPFLLVVHIDVAPEAEEEFNDWYTNVHMREVVDVPGFRWGKRYRVFDNEVYPPAANEQRYLAIYEFDGPEVLTSPAFSEARGAGRPTRGWKPEIAPYLSNRQIAVFEEIGSYRRPE